MPAWAEYFIFMKTPGTGPARLWSPFSLLSFVGGKTVGGGGEVKHLSTSSAVVKNEWSFTSAYICFRGVYIESFTFGLGIQ